MKIKLNLANLNPSINNRFYDIDQVMEKCNERDELYVYDSRGNAECDATKLVGKCDKVVKEGDKLVCEVDLYDTEYGKHIKELIKSSIMPELAPTSKAKVEDNKVDIEHIVKMDIKL